MSALPKGWSVELLGLIAAVKFTSPSGSGLMWMDGTWRTFGVTIGTFPHHYEMLAPGVPQAKTMAEARKIGTAFIVEATS